MALILHMQRCRELFAAAMHGVDNLVYDSEGDRLLLLRRAENMVSLSLDEEEGSGESKEEGEGVE